MESTDLKTALEHLQARYITLSTYMMRLREVAQKTGKNVPLDVMKAYNAGVQDYLRFGKEIFDELNKRKLVAEQVLYRDGKPVLDANSPSGYKTLKLVTPLRPPVFQITSVSGTVEVGYLEPKTPVGAVTHEVGVAAALVPALYFIGKQIGTLAVSRLVIWGVGGYFTLKALQEIRIAVRGPDYTPDKQVDAYLAAYNKMVADGMKPEDAAKRAASVADKPPSSSLGLFAVGLPVAALVAVAGVIGYSLYKK